MSKYYDGYEPTDEEWENIEKMCAQEEEIEIEDGKSKDKQELEKFKDFLKDNGMTWEYKKQLNSKKEKEE